MVRRKDILFLSGILVLLVAGLMFLVSRVSMVNELIQVTMMIAGMLMMAALSGISSYLEGSSNVPLIKISFNESQTREALDDLITVAYAEEKQRDLSPKIQTWEPTSDSLKDEDPALALAKLRLDIERELRRIAYEQKVAIEPHKTIRHLLDTLIRREALPDRVGSAIRDVLPVCNMAIHGGEVTNELASGVLSVGADLLRVLRVTGTSSNAG